MHTNTTAAAWLRGLANTLTRSERHGAAIDKPEGSRFLTISDTLAADLARQADAIAADLVLYDDLQP